MSKRRFNDSIDEAREKDGRREKMLTLILFIIGIVLGYGTTWFLVLKCRRIIHIIDKEQISEAREITQRLKLQ